jgi:hypothetical protein
MKMHLTLLASCLLFGCGEDVSQKQSSTSDAILCDDSPVAPGEHVSVSHGCAFEQQLINISKFGTPVSGKAQVTAGAQATGVAATASCKTWVLGTDAQGVQVIVNTSTGEVRSHGMFHQGAPSSTLPASLALPVQLTP